MLFYNKIKRDFSHISWKRGQIYFREERVKDVRMDGDLVVGKVQGRTEAAYDTAIMISKGGIFNSKCSCPVHRVRETHCKHVAALSIWVVERGSLLRLGIGTADHGMAPGGLPEEVMLKDVDFAMSDSRIRKLLMGHPELKESKFVIRRDFRAGSLEGQDLMRRSFSIPVTLVEIVALQEHTRPVGEEAQPEPILAEPVVYVRGLFQNKVFTGISVEPAIRYTDPDTDEAKVDTLNYLTRQHEPGVYRTPDGRFLKLVSDQLPFIETMNAAKIFHQGQAALDNLAKLLTSEHRDRIVMHSNVNFEVDNTPLKLTSMNVGRREQGGRQVSMEFKNQSMKFTSQELSELSKQGQVSGQYVMKDNRLYRFETSLTLVQRYANRSGVAAGEGAPESPHPAQAPDGFTSLHDDEQYPLHPLATYRLSLELGVENFTVDEEWTEFHEWKKLFEKKRTAGLPEVDYGFKLREYQTNGLSWLWSLYHRGLAALLADDMGLGKTHQVLAFLTSVYSGRNKPKAPSLVIAPTSVVAAWAHKLEKYDTGLRWKVFHGKDRKLPSKGVDLVLTTYGILQREAALRDRDWHIVALDEAQAIKNAGTINARASRALKAKFKIAMSGTPVENHATDLWSIMEFLLPGYLGSLPRFKRLYGSGRDGSSPAQIAALRRLVSPFLLRRTKAQVLTELPEKTEEVVACEMTEIQKKVYRAFLNSQEAVQARSDLKGEGKINYANILALLTRLKQVCDHPRLPDLTSGKVKKIKSLDPMDTGKWETFEEILNEALGSDLKVVVFTQYIGMMDLIGEYLNKHGVQYAELKGATQDRAKVLNRFQTDPECKVFVCSLLAGSLGIDLTAGSVCVHMDRWWNPARENQATDRLHRIGQTRGVQVFKLQIPGTVEDRISQIIQSKVALSDALIEESALGLKAFSRKELLSLLAPIPE